MKSGVFVAGGIGGCPLMRSGCVEMAGAYLRVASVAFACGGVRQFHGLKSSIQSL